MPTLARAGVTLVFVTFAMLGNPTREGGFMPGELAPPEDRPVAATSSRDARDSGLFEGSLIPSPARKPPATDRDYWRWYGRTHVGDRVVAP
ncbi:MAG: hypothetical protein AB7I30_17295 [Isosphaeraceae bacterium]